MPAIVTCASTRAGPAQRRRSRGRGRSGSSPRSAPGSCWRRTADQLVAVVLEIGLDRVTPALEGHLAGLGLVPEPELQLHLAPVAHVPDRRERAPGRQTGLAWRRSSHRRGSRGRGGSPGSATSRGRSAPRSQPRRSRRRPPARHEPGKSTAHCRARMPPIEPPVDGVPGLDAELGCQERARRRLGPSP